MISSVTQLAPLQPSVPVRAPDEIGNGEKAEGVRRPTAPADSVRGIADGAHRPRFDLSTLIALQRKENGDGEDGEAGGSPGRGAPAAGHGNAAPPPVEAAQGGTGPAVLGELSEAERAEVAELKRRDAEVRAHEAAHASVGGAFAGSPSFEFETGPDGKRYAVGGEVPIDVSPVPGDPQATIQKMQVVKRAANAPAQPSGQDRTVAATAAQVETQARAELQRQRAEETAALNEDTGPEDKAREAAGPDRPRQGAATGEGASRPDPAVDDGAGPGGARGIDATAFAPVTATGSPAEEDGAGPAPASPFDALAPENDPFALARADVAQAGNVNDNERDRAPRIFAEIAARRLGDAARIGQSDERQRIEIERAHGVALPRIERLA